MERSQTPRGTKPVKLFKLLTLVLCRLGLALVFIMAGWPKMLDPGTFATSIENYQLLPWQLINLWALILPWIELSAGVALLAGLGCEIAGMPIGQKLTRGGAVLCGLLLIVFLVAIGSAVMRDLNIDCGCFGTQGGRGVGLAAIGKDLGFLLLALGSLIPLPAKK